MMTNTKTTRMRKQSTVTRKNGWKHHSSQAIYAKNEVMSDIFDTKKGQSPGTKPKIICNLRNMSRYDSEDNYEVDKMNPSCDM